MSEITAASLSVRFPDVAPQRLLDELVPPPHFADARFGTYRPDPAQPSQAAALDQLSQFAAGYAETKQRAWSRKRAQPSIRPGVYLDGGFGVGKTHLLASLWHATPGPKAFGTFVSMTNLVGALGFGSTVDALADFRLVCIDEFELDDPGDTVLMSTLLNRLVQTGVRLAATSNTLPEALGEGRFAADDFLREIQGLSSHFAAIRIDGDDYRHRGLPHAPPPQQTHQVTARAQQTSQATLDDFASLIRHLADVHPSKYGALIDDVQAVFFTDVTEISEQADGLRFVALVDRLYDRDVPVVASGVRLESVFAPELLASGYRKKYFRATSRLSALARLTTSGSGSPN